MENNNRFLPSQTAASASAETAQFMSRVYGWMTAGVALTTVISVAISSDESLLMSIVSNPILFYGCMIAQLAAVLSMGFLLNRINSTVASALYFLYSALTGVTLSILFLIYTRQSLASVFAISAFSFAGLSAFGYATKRDLGPIGSFCAMGLFGLVGWGLLSLFFPSLMGGALSPTYSVLGIIVFAGLTAYDTQKIKAMHAASGSDDIEGTRKAAVYGALMLYLDFINLFLNILRLMGKRR